MCIDISNLLQNEGARREFSQGFDINSIPISGNDYSVETVKPLHLSVVNAGDQILEIEYSGEVRVAIPCARCLEDTMFPVSYSGAVKADMKLADEEREEIIFIEDKKLYTDILIMNEILMRWPIRVLCKEDCKGICSRCGANLNDIQCNCEKEILDPRMAAISDIFSQFKEV